MGYPPPARAQKGAHRAKKGGSPDGPKIKRKNKSEKKKNSIERRNKNEVKNKNLKRALLE